jgi:hypothetical protein
MLLIQIVFVGSFIWFLLGFFASNILHKILKHSPLDTELWPDLSKKERNRL